MASDESMYLAESPDAPVYIRAEQPNAASLGVLILLYGYFAYFTRYANPASKISGTGLVAPAGHHDWRAAGATKVPRPWRVMIRPRSRRTCMACLTVWYATPYSSARARSAGSL
jgi:hypothetical protein